MEQNDIATSNENTEISAENDVVKKPNIYVLATQCILLALFLCFIINGNNDIFKFFPKQWTAASTYIFFAPPIAILLMWFYQLLFKLHQSGRFKSRNHHGSNNSSYTSSRYDSYSSNSHNRRNSDYYNYYSPTRSSNSYDHH